MRYTPETLGQYHNSWAWVVLCAPNQFKDSYGVPEPDQREALLAAFKELRAGFHFARQKLKDERLSEVAAELIEMSLEAYLAGDTKTGAHSLQECEGLIWPSRRLRVKYAIEAERRAFGENVLYADMIASPFPYEGTDQDLGPDQATLLALAMRWSREFQAQARDFKYFSWVVDVNGITWRTSVEPKEDMHPILKPVQRSRGFKRLSELGQTGQIRACILMEIMAPRGDGLVSYDLEEIGKPRVSARQLFIGQDDGFHYEQMRFHLDHSEIFSDD